jgi:uncharacterized protein YjiS (DUF1127 family)
VTALTDRTVAGCQDATTPNGRVEDHVMVAEPFWQLTGSQTLRNAASRVEVVAGRMVANVLLWQERGRLRAALARLDDHLLRDIGLSREEAARECAKPVWRA